MKPRVHAGGVRPSPPRARSDLRGCGELEAGGETESGAEGSEEALSLGKPLPPNHGARSALFPKGESAVPTRPAARLPHGRMSGQSEEATAFFSTGRFQQTFVCFWQRGGGVDRNAGEPSAVRTRCPCRARPGTRARPSRPYRSEVNSSFPPFSTQ